VEFKDASALKGDLLLSFFIYLFFFFFFKLGDILLVLDNFGIEEDRVENEKQLVSFQNQVKLLY
jgi:hypothetical protein